MDYNLQKKLISRLKYYFKVFVVKKYKIKDQQQIP